MSTPDLARLTFAQAEARHGRLALFYDDKDGLLADCEVDGERCFSFALALSLDSLHQQFIEHAAEALGICWACSQPVDGWTNRQDCRRCWLMWNAHNGVLPRDAGQWPGEITTEATI